MSGDQVILSEALQAIAAQVENLKRGEPLGVAFYHWMLGVDIGADRQAALAADMQKDVSGGGRSIQSVAALGYLLGHAPALVRTHGAAFQQGIEWLLGRTGGSQDGFAALLQPVAQLGLLVGLVAVGDAELFGKFARWFDALLERAAPATADWRHELLEQIRLRLHAGLLANVKLEMSSAGAVFAARGLASLRSAESDVLAPALLGRLKALNYSDAEQAAVDLAAYRYLARGELDINLRAPSLDDIAKILHRIPAALRRWTWEDQKKTPNSTVQKWAVENEYHFQNLLYTILVPVFHDLRDEEWLASVGQKKPRADLVIPALHLVVEVKFWRANTSPQEVISQIAEDVGLYLKKESPYRHVLPVIWDQGRRMEQHDYLIGGLAEIRDVVTPVIVPQPAFMSPT